MQLSKILFSVTDGVATITLNRPDKLNSFDREMALETIDALDKAKDDATVRAVLLTGEGRAFCAGQDLSDAAAGADIEGTLRREYEPMLQAVIDCRAPVICAAMAESHGPTDRMR